MNSNYDTQELEKFSHLAMHWWDPQGELKTLHQINPLRLCYIKNKIDLKGKTVLDVGCGGGILSESMAASGAKVTGIDMSQSVITVAKYHKLESAVEVEYLHKAAETLAEERPAHYDVITCLEMLEHVPDPAAIVKACASLLKPGGHIFFSTLNRNVKSYLLAIVAAEHLLKILPKYTHDYAKFIRPAELCQWAEEAHLSPQDMQGIRYQPFSQTFSLTPNVSVNYLLHAIKL